MYEDKGFCPSNEFTIFAMEEAGRLSRDWEKVIEILGPRIGYMVYSHHGRCYEDWCYIVDATMGASGTLGLEVAETLKEMIPECVYAEKGRAIICSDFLSFSQFPRKIEPTNNDRTKWQLSSTTETYKAVLHEDERYVVVIEDRELVVHIYIAKK